MAAAPLRLLLLAVALFTGACDRQPRQPSVTVKLPPARPAPPRPAFSFREHRSPEPGSRL